ncbi:MAG: hypothetical protein JKY24_04610 [Pseudomonadales bacterium]|nr:hypothetical protein [Pseudomonadales bacterium]
MVNWYKKYRITFENETRLIDYPLAAVICGVSEKTVLRWINGEQKPHPACIELLTLKMFGLVTSDNDRWNGWRFYEDKLYSPEGTEFTHGNLNAYFITMELQRTLSYENRQLKYKLNLIENPPIPLKSAEIIDFSEYLNAKEAPEELA